MANLITRDPKALRNRYGEPRASLPTPDLTVGDKVKITSTNEKGLVTGLERGSLTANVTMDDGKKKFVPLVYMEKMT